MSVKEQVLLLLEENKGEAISGEDIASKLSCTRASVWKAVNALKKDGYHVEAVNNKGYTLKISPDVLSKAYIQDKVSTAGIEIEIETHKSVDSTNNYLKQLADKGERRQFVCISEEQTAGKGRHGRSFFSPKNTGIYISFLLFPKVDISEASMYTTIAATASAKAIEKVSGFKTDIKWVNDIYMRGKKVTGILTEASTSIEDGSLDYVIVGIGINLYEPSGGFPDEIKDVAGAVFTGKNQIENLRNNIAAELIIQFMNYVKDGLSGANFLKEYEKRLFVIGKDVRLLTPDHEKISDDDVTVHVLGINEKCHLHVRFEDGHEEYLSGGEISVRV